MGKDHRGMGLPSARVGSPGGRLLLGGVPMLRTATNSATPSTATTPTVQDNELPWLDWEHADDQLLAFCADIVAFRRRHPAFRRRRFFEERPIFGTELSDIGWFRPVGQEMTPDDWKTGIRQVPRRLPQR